MSDSPVPGGKTVLVEFDDGIAWVRMNRPEKRNAIEDVKSVRGDDLEVAKEGGEATVTANWSVKVPLVSNVNACLDFTATTAK